MTKKKLSKADEDIDNQNFDVKDKTTEKEVESTQNESQTEDSSAIIDELTAKVAELQDKYQRLMAEFDNYRKRTIREKAELCQTAGEDILKSILPVMDDFDRAIAAMDNADNVEAVKEGVLLISKKLTDFMAGRGVKEIEAMGRDFDTDLHESIAFIPATDPSQKGKVMDVTTKGYMLYDKVLRFAKVVIGQ